MNARSGLEFGVAILAAGASSRMGRPKMLLPWNGTSIIGHLLRQWSGLEAKQIAVVCAASDQRMWMELGALAFPEKERIPNHLPNARMFDSIRCAAQWGGWRKDLTHFVLVLGDQPHLSNHTLATILEFALAHPEHICQPCRTGRPRHPVVLPRSQFLELSRTREETLKDFLGSRPEAIRYAEMDDPGLDLDIDYPADFEKARALFEQQEISSVTSGQPEA